MKKHVPYVVAFFTHFFAHIRVFSAEKCSFELITRAKVLLAPFPFIPRGSIVPPGKSEKSVLSEVYEGKRPQPTCENSLVFRVFREFRNSAKSFWNFIFAQNQIKMHDETSHESFCTFYYFEKIFSDLEMLALDSTFGPSEVKTSAFTDKKSTFWE